MLFALPFAAVGVAAAGWMAWALWHSAEAHWWVETPAKILEARLVESDGEDGTTYRAEATYEYTFGGRSYRSTRVSFYGGSDNIGSFQQDVYRELSRYAPPPQAERGRVAVEADPRAQDRPMFRCYVNPDNPQEAVLYRGVRIGMLLLQAVFALAFGGAGFGLIIGQVRASAKRKKREVLAERVPEHPWKWREDWASGVVRADRSLAMAALLLAGFWNLIAFPLAICVVPAALRQGQYLALLALLFPAVGVVFAVWAVRETVRRVLFGGAALELVTVPGVIGGKLAGVIRVPRKVEAADGFHLTLKCARTVSKETSDGRSTEEIVLWEDVQTIAVDAERDPTRTAVPVLFAVPHDQPQSNPDAADPVAWRLELSADNPGIDLAVRFEVPVFRTAESSPSFRLDDRPIRPFLAAADPLEELRRAKIRVESTEDGLAFVFPPARFLGQAFGVTAFALIWTGAVVGMVIARASGDGPPLFFPLVFGFVDLFVLWLFLDSWAGTGRIEVGSGTLRWRRGIFGLGSHGEFEKKNLRELLAVAGSRAGTNQRYAVAAVDSFGRRQKISREVGGKRVAETLIAELRRALA